MNRFWISVIASVIVLAAGAVYAQPSLWWPFPENKTQPDFVSEIRVIAHMEPTGGGHGATYEPRYIRVRVLRNKSGSACWIGNDTDPHNRASAPVEVCR